MKAYKFILLSCVLLLLGFTPKQPCDISNDAVMIYQDQILRSVETKTKSNIEWLNRIRPALSCLYEIQESGDGKTKILANSTLRFLFGGKLLSDFKNDRRLGKSFIEATKRLTAVILASPKLASDSELVNFAKGEWTLYSNFCEGSWTYGCSKMLPDAVDIKSQAPLLAAADIVHLRRAYYSTEGLEKKQIGLRIKKLYQELPDHPPAVRRMIDEVYEDVFGAQPHLKLS